jgi:mRNA interferase MazF
MPAVNAGEVWMIDFGMAAKVRPALLLTGAPADDELDVVTTLLHTTALRGNQWELSIPKPFLKPGAFTSNKFKPFRRLNWSESWVRSILMK